MGRWSNAALLRDAGEHELDRRRGSVAQREREVRRAAVAVMRIEGFAIVIVVVTMSFVRFDRVIVVFVLGVVAVVMMVVDLAAVVIVRQRVENEVERGNGDDTDGEGKRDRRGSRSVSPRGHPVPYDAPA
jgi:hypothetical protein